MEISQHRVLEELVPVQQSVDQRQKKDCLSFSLSNKLSYQPLDLLRQTAKTEEEKNKTQARIQKLE